MAACAVLHDVQVKSLVNLYIRRETAHFLADTTDGSKHSKQAWLAGLEIDNLHKLETKIDFRLCRSIAEHALRCAVTQ